MKFRLVQLHSDSYVKTHSPQACVTVYSKEEVSLALDEVGILLPKRTHHRQGAFMMGGLLNPGWKGKPTIEIVLFGELEIKEGDEVAHALILQGENTEGYTFVD